MNALSVLLWAIVALTVLVIIYRKLTYTISVDTYEYLTVISFEWKSGREIRQEIQRKKRGRVSGPRFYQQLSQLENEGLIERRIISGECEGQTIAITQFRKIISNNRTGPKETGEESSSPRELVPVGT